MSEAILQYLLGYCAWWGLSTIGEPPLHNSLRPDYEDRGIHSVSSGRIYSAAGRNDNYGKDPMPVWMISIFIALGAGRYILTFLISYIFQVISTVTMVSSAEDTSIRAAAFAIKHPAAVSKRDSPQRARRKLSKTGTFQPEPLSRKNRTFTRRMTMPIESLGRKFFGLACLRGLNAYLVMSISQWFFGTIGDLFLSGQPKELQPGYGSTSIILIVFFGGSFALWTHYAITEPSDSRSIYAHFPRGKDILHELYPITCVWACCEQMTRSLPLALSRSQIFALRQYAWTPALWNTLDAGSQRILLFKFGVLYLFYLFLVAALSIPASMTLRRIHASMLPDVDEAIVPFVRGNPKPREDEESSTHSPGLSISEAYATLNWSAYLRVLRTFVLYFLLNQLLHFLYWEADWMLHEVFDADRYASTFPPSPSRLHLRFFG